MTGQDRAHGMGACKSARARQTLSSLLAGLLGLALLSCDQPRPKCGIAPGDFAATYTLLEGTGDCAALPGEILSIQPYYAPRSSRDLRPDYGKVSIAIQPGGITDLLAAGRIDPNAEDTPYAFGSFASSRPQQDDFCVVPTLSVARLRAPELPEEVDVCTTHPAEPAVDVMYEWSNVRVYATPGAYGSQLSAQLRYTRDGCSALYSVSAVYPAVSCAVSPPEDPDAGDPDAGDLDAGESADAGAGDLDGGFEPDIDAGVGLDGTIGADPGANPEGGATVEAGAPADAGGGLDAGAEAEADAEAETDAEAAGDEDADCSMPAPPSDPMPDDTICTQQPDPAHGIPFGSGINSDFAVHCDPTLFLCVLDKEPPSLR